MPRESMVKRTSDGKRLRGTMVGSVPLVHAEMLARDVTIKLGCPHLDAAPSSLPRLTAATYPQNLLPSSE